MLLPYASAAKWGGQKKQGAGGEDSETGQMHLGGQVYVTCRAAGRSRQGLQVLLCSEVGRTKKAGRRWRGDRTDAPRGEVYVTCRDMGKE